MVPVSNDTLLRVVRRRGSPRFVPPTVVGIDDWAWRRNQRYGTIICDLERRRTIALLPDREPATAQAWLSDQPQIAIVARDRGGSYALAAAKALPQATQVADRWHLMENASHAFLDAVRKSMRQIRSAIGVPASGCTLEELEREPGLASGALLVALPYHVSKVARAAPGVPVETIRVEGSEDDQKAVLTLPAGGTVLLVSGSPILLQIAQAIIGGLRGDELLVEARLVSRRAEWRRLLPAADLVLADALSAGVVREARPRRLRELRILGDADLARMRKSLNRAESAA